MADTMQCENVTDQTFEALVLQSSLPVLVDFWAPWCSPSRTIEPAFAALAKKYAGRVRFIRMNVDEGQRTAMSLSVLNIPTLMLFAKGKLIRRQIGLQTGVSLTRMIDQEFLKNAEQRVS